MKYALTLLLALVVRADAEDLIRGLIRVTNHTAFMTNEVYIKAAPSSVLTTNWLPITIDRPRGDGTMEQVRKEVGIVIYSEYATFVAGGRTNRVLVEQRIEHGMQRDQAVVWSATNADPFRWMVQPLHIINTNDLLNIP